VIEGVVVLSVVLEVVKNKNPAVYNRIKALCLNKARRFYVFANELHRCTCILIYTMVCSLLVFFFGTRCFHPMRTKMFHAEFCSQNKTADIIKLLYSTLVIEVCSIIETFFVKIPSSQR
jgi:hypothetical protein